MVLGEALDLAPKQFHRVYEFIKRGVSGYSPMVTKTKGGSLKMMVDLVVDDDLLVPPLAPPCSSCSSSSCSWMRG